jgi:DNA-binding NarL/FixJ family response regulator
MSAVRAGPLSHILLISDQRYDHVQITRTLHAEFPNPKVEQVENEQQLDFALAGGAFDLVFIESWLPWIDSLSVVRVLQDVLPGCPVVMIADAEREEIVLKAVQAGVDSYVLRSSQQMICLS